MRRFVVDHNYSNLLRSIVNRLPRLPALDGIGWPRLPAIDGPASLPSMVSDGPASMASDGPALDDIGWPCPRWHRMALPSMASDGPALDGIGWLRLSALDDIGWPRLPALDGSQQITFDLDGSILKNKTDVLYIIYNNKYS